MLSRQMTLTGNEDTDVMIINSLTLKELRNVCQINQYTSDLCANHIDLKSRFKNVKKIVNRIVNLIKNRVMGVTLNMNDEKEKFKVFNDLMIELGISDDADKEDEDEENPSNVFNQHIVFHLEIFKYGQGYILQYYMGRDLYDNQGFNEDKTVFSTFDVNQLQEFLLHLYYNQLILVI